MGTHVIKSITAPIGAPTLEQIGFHHIKVSAPEGHWVAVDTSPNGWVDLVNLPVALNSRGDGESLVGAKTGSALSIKSIVAGDNITLESTEDSVIVNSIGGTGGGNGDLHATITVTSSDVYIPTNVTAVLISKGSWSESAVSIHLPAITDLNSKLTIVLDKDWPKDPDTELYLDTILIKSDEQFVVANGLTDEGRFSFGSMHLALVFNGVWYVNSATSNKALYIYYDFEDGLIPENVQGNWVIITETPEVSTIDGLHSFGTDPHLETTEHIAKFTCNCYGDVVISFDCSMTADHRYTEFSFYINDDYNNPLFTLRDADSQYFTTTVRSVGTLTLYFKLMRYGNGSGVYDSAMIDNLTIQEIL